MKTKFILVFISILFLISCNKEIENRKIHKAILSGYAQKGPFLSGGLVSVFELSENFIQSGKTFITKINDNIGSFTFSNLDLASQYILLKVDGYYYNEVKGENENTPLTLFSICDISELYTFNVNILTTLEVDRVYYLVKQGIPFETAKDSAKGEVLRVFGIIDSNIKSEYLDITKGGEENAALLAISLIMQSNRAPVELSELLANFINDFEKDGQINDPAIISKLYQSANTLNLSAIRLNLEKRFEELGLKATINSFEEKVNDFIQQQQILNIKVSKNISCNGSPFSSINLMVTGGQPPYSYVWANGMTTESISNIGPGNYTVTVTDVYNQKIETEISIPDKINIAHQNVHLSELNISGSASIAVAGGEPPYTYSWSNGSYSEILSNLQVGNYRVTVTDSNLCKDSLQIIIGDNREKVADIDGNVYNVIYIGNQCWFRENLKVGKSNANLSFCNPDSLHKEVYGMFYPYYMINDVCPDGWHLPSLDEWDILIKYLGGASVACDKLREAGPVHWSHPNSATNESGFTALPAGCFIRQDHGSMPGKYFYTGDHAIFWNADMLRTPTRERIILDNSKCYFSESTTLDVYYSYYPIRCIKD